METKLEIVPAENGILIKSKKKARAGWREQLAAAIKEGQQPYEELLEGFNDEFTVNGSQHIE